MEENAGGAVLPASMPASPAEPSGLRPPSAHSNNATGVPARFDEEVASTLVASDFLIDASSVREAAAADASLREASPACEGKAAPPPLQQNESPASVITA